VNSYDDQKRFLLKAARRLQAIEAAKDSLAEYARLCHPHPEDPDDVTLSLYEVTPVSYTQLRTPETGTNIG